MGEVIERRWGWIVAGIAMLGLGLRIAAAQGGLWLDEAWSAVMAHQAGTPVGVFANINHDNNHHLNSLWLQLVGLDAAPWLQRGLSIITGTAAIPVAAALARRRSAFAGIIAALFFALSPILVTYGSEARGYAPMLLALMIAALLVQRWIDDPRARPPALPLAVLGLLGVLAQLTMMFGLASLGFWSLLACRRSGRGWLAHIARLWLPCAVAVALALLAIFVPAWREGGMAFGSTEPFTFGRWIAGFGQAIDHAFGQLLALLGPFVLLAAITGIPRGRLLSLAAAMILVPPLCVVVGQLPNAGGARIYLIAATGSLLILAAMIDHARSVGHRRMAAISLLLVVASMAAFAGRVIVDRRADPSRALATIAARAPGGADIAVDQPRSEAILVTAAASAAYPLALRQSCPAARFLFVERDGAEPFPTAPIHCAAGYHEIAGDTVQGLSGTQWKLFERSAR